MMLKVYASRFLFITALILGNGLLLTPEGSALRVTGALILYLLPGLAWTDRWLPLALPFTRWIIGAGLSYSLVIISGLILHYLPGPIPFWAELLTLNSLALAPLLWPARAVAQPYHNTFTLRLSAVGWILLIILFLAAFFRFTSLGYSEFQGDEVKAMHPAAHALVGHQDALFLYRKKGPAEVLAPMVLWGLTGTINEFTARLPFALAGFLIVPTIYLLGERLLNRRAGLVAAGLMAFNGLLVAFSRIVQYQVIVVWLSALALLCLWEWREQRHTRWLTLAGIFLGAGLLAHYDIIFVVPALAWLAISNLKLWPLTGQVRSLVLSLLVGMCCLVVIAGLFYFPYLLDPQVERTTEYLTNRIGLGLAPNNLDFFMRVNFFYNSIYYLAVIGLLTVGLLAWALYHHAWVRRIPGSQYWLPALVFSSVIGLMAWPTALEISGVDLAALLFGLILLGAFLSPVFDSTQRALVIWLALPFLFYNFVVAKPGTHTYTIIASWTLLAGLAATQLWDWAASQRRLANSTLLETGSLAKAQFRGFKPRSLFLFCGHPLLPIILAVLLAVLSGGYLYLTHLRQDVEYKQDWPESRSAFYWSPYDTLMTEIGLYGYVHQSGWKIVGALYATGQMSGDYGSNELREITAWYIRDRLRTCDPQPKYYITADIPLGYWAFNSNIITGNYDPIGRVALPNSKGVTIYQARPPTEKLGYVEVESLAHAFDRTATPAAFAYAHRESQPVDITLAESVRLVRYDLNVLEARPGGQIEVILYWQPQEHLTTDYQVFVHIEGDGTANSAAGIWGQSDGRPACQFYPAFEWQPKQLIPDPHVFNINPNTPPGDYPILVGMYLPDTGARLAVLDKAGTPVANFVKLTTVTIEP